MVPDQTVMYDICRCHSNQPYITERYLSQTITLLIQRPNASLERTIIEFCARSLRLGTKVCWLLSAAAGDSKHPAPILALREKCERAALNGMAGRVFLATSSNAL